MSRRSFVILTAAIGAGIIALPITYDAASKLEVSAIAAAHAQPRIKNLIARLRGTKLPEGIARSNGRLEATQVDVSAKYAGRISEMNVEEGSPVKVGQVVGKISSPEMEAQLRAAQASVQKAKDAVAAAEAEIVTRRSALEFAKGDFDRAIELIKRRRGLLNEANAIV